MTETMEYRPPLAAGGRAQAQQPDFRPLIAPINHNDHAAYLKLMEQGLNAFLAGYMPRIEASLVINTASKMSRERENVDNRASKYIEHVPQGNAD
jgi:hypothetical protein